MKKIISFMPLAFMLCFAAASAQDCKFEYSKKDKFSGETKVGYMYNMGKPLFDIYKVGQQVTIEVLISFDGAMTQPVEQGQQGVFRLASAETVVFVVRETTQPVVKVNASQYAASYTTTYKVKYDVSADDVAKLSVSAPVAFKINLGKEYANDIPEKKSLKIMEAFKCLKDHNGK